MCTCVVCVYEEGGEGERERGSGEREGREKDLVEVAGLEGVSEESDILPERHKTGLDLRELTGHLR